MKLYIAIVLGSKRVDRIYVNGVTTDDCYNKAFEYADLVHGVNTSYELFDLGNPRHRVLFETELQGMFIKNLEYQDAIREDI